MILRRGIMAVSLIVLTAGVGTAQEDPATHPGTFQLRVDTHQGEALTNAAQMRVAGAVGDKLIAVLKGAAALAHPVGYQTIVRRMSGSNPEEKGFGMPYYYGVTGFNVYFALTDDGQGGKIMTGEGGSVAFSMVVNQASRMDDVGEKMALDGGPAVLQGYRITGQFRGRPVYDGECVAFTRRPLPSIIPVTKERYYKLKILQMRGDSARHAGQQRDRGATPMADALAKFLRERPQREADMRRGYEAVEKTDPKAAQEMLNSWKKMEADAEAQMRASAPEQDRQIHDAVAGGAAHVGEQLQKLQATLDALSPVERKKPAAVFRLGVDGERLVDLDSPDAVPLSQVNPVFFDRTLSPDVPQLLMVCLPGLQSAVSPRRYAWTPEHNRDMARIRDQLDWSALEAIINPKP